MYMTVWCGVFFGECGYMDYDYPFNQISEPTIWYSGSAR
jgi:hypothetical protein